MDDVSVEKPGTQIMGIDILPAELPIESSQHFSNVLFPHIKDLVNFSRKLCCKYSVDA